MQNPRILRIVVDMTMRIAIIAFVVSFAVITGWLIKREPAANTMAETAPSLDVGKKAVATAPKPDDIDTPSEQPIALSDTERLVRTHLNQIVIPTIDLENVSVEEAIDFFRLRVRELYPTGDSTVRGMSFVIRKPSIDGNGEEPLDTEIASREPEHSTIDILAHNITAKNALDMICEKAGYRWGITEYCIELTPLD